MSAPPQNTNLPSAEETCNKMSAPRVPLDNPYHVDTQMITFLKSVENTPYDPILREIDEYLKKKVERDDEFLRKMKNRLQVAVDNYKEDQEKEINKWFDKSVEGLKLMSTVSLVDNLVPGILLAYAPAISADGKVTQPTIHNYKEGKAMNQAVLDMYEKEINDYLLVQLEEYQAAAKKTKDATYRKLNKLAREADEKYEAARKDDEVALLGMFMELKFSEDNTRQLSTEIADDPMEE